MLKRKPGLSNARPGFSVRFFSQNRCNQRRPYSDRAATRSALAAIEPQPMPPLQ